MISKMDILKIIPPKILDRISLMLVIFITTTSNTRKDLLILSQVSTYSSFNISFILVYIYYE
jgi:hypothetical protein